MAKEELQHLQETMISAWKAFPQRPGKKAHETRRLLKQFSNIPKPAQQAILNKFENYDELPPAIKAHFTMGTYNKFLRLGK